MIGLLSAIFTFNLTAYKIKNRLTKNQTLHIWTFTIAFQVLFDIIVEFKYNGYWYFSKDVDFGGLLAHVFLLPPVNMIFLAFFPFHATFNKKWLYIAIWTIGILLYEMITLLPEPWGYFHYGWWTIWHAVVLDPILLLILVGYYKWILRLEVDINKKPH